MDNTQQTNNPTVNASPVKSFFVSMLTRDIQLEDAVLDLLDNCVDGILRSGKSGGQKPYEGFKADIAFSEDVFSISDNCGGIPWNLRDYAFRMGRSPDRPRDAPGSVGVYGIGMKRALFKIGKRCRISTQNRDNQYEVNITPEWIDDESTWEIPLHEEGVSMCQDGTRIVVTDLNTGISSTFGGGGAESFMSGLKRVISTHYAYIIEKGFEVTVNGDLVKPRTAKIVYEDAIHPYVFKSQLDGVEVYLTVGLTRPIPSEDEIAAEQQSVRYSSEYAGWTILCNDRAVLYCDRTELTGWGEAGVPRYHPQFISISGIVEFKSEDPSKLPTTTTKRGIDASSTLYLQVKNKMRDGMKVFTDYTNKWKGREDEAKKQLEDSSRLSLEEIRVKARELPFRRLTQSRPPGDQYRPQLPSPLKVKPSNRRISFAREVTKIKAVAEYLDDPDLSPSEVGEVCFDTMYDEARS